MNGLYLFSISDQCNRNCKYCVQTSGELHKVDNFIHADKKWVITEANEFEGNIICVSGGEPLMHPDIIEIVESIDKKIVVFTNGDFIDDFPVLLDMSNVHWCLSTHPLYTSIDQFISKRDKFPIERTIIHHTAFDSIQSEATLHYVGDYHYFVSGNVLDKSNYDEFRYTPCVYTDDELREVVSKSRFATSDGFIYNGVCAKSYNSFVHESPHQDQLDKLKDDPWINMDSDNILANILNTCSKDCNSVRTSIILSKWIGA